MSTRSPNMGKTDKNHAKLQFEQGWSQAPVWDHAVAGVSGGGDMTPGEEPELRQILAAMQQSLPQIDIKIDSLSYRMDRMTERLAKRADRLDQSERCISEMEDGQATMSSGHAKICKELAALQAKVDDLEAHSPDNQILGNMGSKLEDFQDTALTEIQHMGKYATACVYGEGERAGRVLANMIHRSREKDTITAVQAEDGSELIDPEQIVNRFREYYI
ncbi:hypothetical protein NDU88_004399 [Pleurodeles waltl]|uniref:Uncharacterized protein n=1 Tax=Pleurodeles waltl TaxID=8319 RepID=A0AAV7MUT1_PLEWA|nr:hypothetical protein NDU88_004399 [Pleurodeles waltl]